MFGASVIPFPHIRHIIWCAYVLWRTNLHTICYYKCIFWCTALSFSSNPLNWLITSEHSSTTQFRTLSIIVVYEFKQSERVVNIDHCVMICAVGIWYCMQCFMSQFVGRRAAHLRDRLLRYIIHAMFNRNTSDNWTVLSSDCATYNTYNCDKMRLHRVKDICSW